MEGDLCSDDSRSALEYYGSDQEEGRRDISVSEGVSSFPSCRTELWDRSAIGSTIIVRSSDVLPDVQICPRTMRLLGIHVDKKVDESLASGNSATEKEASACFIIGRLMIEKECQLTVDIDRFDPGKPHSHNFGIRPTILMQTDYPVLIQMEDPERGSSPAKGRTFNETDDYSERNVQEQINSMRTIFRKLNSHCCDDSVPLSLSELFYINGKASLASEEGFYGDNTVRSSSAKRTSIGLSLELIVPSCSLSFTPINSTCMANCRLAKYLDLSSQVPESEVIPEWGYLTLDAHGNVLPLYCDQEESFERPIAGVWIKDIVDVTHPFVWAACLRYIHSDRIKDRAFMPPANFLVIISGNGRKRFFECSVGAEKLPFLYFSGKCSYKMASKSNNFQTRVLCNMSEVSKASARHCFLRALSSSVPYATGNTSFVVQKPYDQSNGSLDKDTVESTKAMPNAQRSGNEVNKSKVVKKSSSFYGDISGNGVLDSTADKIYSEQNLRLCTSEAQTPMCKQKSKQEYVTLEAFEAQQRLLETLCRQIEAIEKHLRHNLCPDCEAKSTQTSVIRQSCESTSCGDLNRLSEPTNNNFGREDSREQTNDSSIGMSRFKAVFGDDMQSKGFDQMSTADSYQSKVSVGMVDIQSFAGNDTAATRETSMSSREQDDYKYIDEHSNNSAFQRFQQNMESMPHGTGNSNENSGTEEDIRRSMKLITSKINDVLSEELHGESTKWTASEPPEMEDGEMYNSVEAEIERSSASDGWDRHNDGRSFASDCSKENEHKGIEAQSKSNLSDTMISYHAENYSPCKEKGDICFLIPRIQYNSFSENSSFDITANFGDNLKDALNDSELSPQYSIATLKYMDKYGLSSKGPLSNSNQNSLLKTALSKRSKVFTQTIPPTSSSETNNTSTNNTKSANARVHRVIDIEKLKSLQKL
eukprot:Nk52_evm32s356 gene=Nk52_evmTU32s356